MTTQPVSRARARRAGRARASRVGVDERLDRDVLAAARACASSSSSEPSRLRRQRLAARARTSLVLSFAACTSGWSNGLIPRIEPGDGGRELPAEELLRRGRTDRRAAPRPRWRSGPSGGSSPARGRAPCPPCRSTRRAAARPRARSRRVSRRCQTLSRPSLQPSPSSQPELEARVLLAESARLDHLLRALEQALDVDAHQRGRHHAEGRQRRVPPADRRLAVERRTRSRAPCASCLELGARVGDRGEELAPLAGPSQK